MTQRRGFLRDNAFLLAAVALPLIVILFFLVATAIPRWTVAAPQYDLVLRADSFYDQPNPPRVSVDYAVRDGQVEATFRPLAQTAYPSPSRLYLFDHTTLNVRPIPIDIPTGLKEGDPPRVVVVESLAGRRVTPDTTAPDGYRLENRTRRGPGLVGEIFGMNRYDAAGALVNRGRVIPITLPTPYQYPASMYVVGWIADGTR